MHHIVVRHGIVTSVRDVVLVSCRLAFGLLFDSMFSVLMILLWTWIIQSLRFNYRPNTCTGSLAGWTVRTAGVVLFSSPILFWHCSWFPHNQDHRPAHSSCHVALPPRPILFFFSSAHFVSGFTLRAFLTWSTILQPNNPGLVEDCFFVSLHCTLMCPSGGFLLSSANLVTPIQGSDTDFIAFHVPIIIDSGLLKYINACFCLAVNINIILRSRKIVFRSKEFCSRSNLMPIYVIFPSCSRTLVELEHLDLHLWLLLFLLNNFTEIPAWDSSPLWTQR